MGPASDLYPLTITTADRALTVSSPARRIVLLDGAGETILDALGAGDRVLAVVPLDGNGVSAADLRGLRADLVVAPSATDEKTLSKAASAGVPVYVTPDTSVHEVERAVTQLGLIVAEPAAARRRVRDIERRRQRVARLLRGAPRTRVFVDLGNFTTASDRSLIGDLVRAAKGQNIAADVPDGLPLSIQQLRALDPDVYVAAAGLGATLAELRADPRTKGLRAVRNGRVVVVDSRLLSPGPRVGAGLEALARALHPDAFR